MSCNTLAAQQKAAHEALSVSEHELQRIKQQGCFTTSRDRSIMRNPDYRALPYPQLANPIQSLEFDPNNKYTAINQAAGYMAPFIEGVTNQKIEMRPVVPGMSMADTGDLAAISGAYLESEETQKRSVYARIADSIRGAPMDDRDPMPAQQASTELGEPSERVATSEHSKYTQSAAQGVTGTLYGSSGKLPQDPLPRGKATPASFVESCKLHCKAALYDLMHYDALLPDRLAAEGCKTRIGYVLTRRGRLSYLLFTLMCLFVVFYAMWSCFSR